MHVDFEAFVFICFLILGLSLYLKSGLIDRTLYMLLEQTLNTAQKLKCPKSHAFKLETTSAQNVTIFLLAEKFKCSALIKAGAY